MGVPALAAVPACGQSRPVVIAAACQNASGPVAIVVRAAFVPFERSFRAPALHDSWSSL